MRSAKLFPCGSALGIGVVGGDLLDLIADEACVFASITSLVVEYIVAIDVTRVRFPADACVVAICWFRLCWFSALLVWAGRIVDPL